MSASQPPSNPLDEVKSGLQESPPHEELKAGLADKQPLLQNNQPRYAFGWFDKWLLIIPALLVLVLCLLGWVSCNPIPSANPAPTSAAAVTSLSLNAPAGGTTTTVGQPITLSGQAPPGSEVQLLNHGKVISTTTADSNGNYEFNLSAAQPGVYELQTVTTINGKPVTSPPVIITVTGPGGNATTAASGGTPVASATGAPNATVVPRAPGGANGTVEANETTAPGASNPTSEANATSNAVTGMEATTQANATSAAGAPGGANPTPAANETSAANATPATTQGGGENVTGEANTTPAANVTPSTNAGATPGAESSGNPPTVFTPPNAALASGTVLTGTAPPNSHVVINFNGKAVGSADADTNGAWQFTVPATVPPGNYTLTVVVTDANGNPVGSPSEAQSVTVTPGTEATPVTGAGAGEPNAANVNPPTINLPVNGLLVAGAVLTGTAPPNTHLVMYVDDKAVGSADSDTNGNWQFAMPDIVPPGKHSVYVVVTDANGNPVASPSETQTITLTPKILLPVTGGEFK